MGGKSKSKSSSSSGQNMQAAAKSQQNLQSALMQAAFPAFGEMLKGGMETMSSNPAMKMFGAAMGMPTQMETPEFMQSFIDKYKPVEEEEPTQQQQFGVMPPGAPQFNVNDYMRNGFMGPRR